jgi:FkbM family methyltransferase
MSDLGPQYNERSILAKFFNHQRHGFLIEVGAADGITHSHTAFMFDEWEWRGVLIEPHPEFFSALQARYENNPDVLTLNGGIREVPGKHRFYMNGQISRFLDDQKIGEGFSKVPGYEGRIDVECTTLTDVCESLGVPREFDFLTVDAEETDIEVLSTLDWERWQPRLVCIEHSMPLPVMNGFFSERSYVQLERNTGNTFFHRIEAKVEDL